MRLWTALLGDAGSLRGQLARAGIGSVLIKVVSTGLSLAVAILLARTLGPDGYGLYAYVFALVSLMAIPAQFGLPKLVVRETAKAQVQERWDRLRGIWRWATGAALLLSLVLLLISLLGVWAFADRFTQAQLLTFAWGLALVPLLALGDLRGAALRGLRKVVQGQLPEHIVRPALFILLVLAALVAGADLTAAQAMGLHALAAAVALLVGAWLLWRARPAPLVGQSVASYEPRAWVASVWPLALVASMHLVIKHTDILILGFFAPAADVGIYRVAMQGALLVAFGLQAANLVVTPYFARFYAQGDWQRLQRVVTLSARLILLMALPVVLVLVLAGEPILEFVFGGNYVAGAVPLAILALGQLVNAAFGSVGALLTMTGHERAVAGVLTAAAGVNIVLNLLLIPLFGMNGAALATATTFFIWNVMLWRLVHRRLGIESTAFAPPRASQASG